MNHKEYKEILNYELYHDCNLSLIYKLRLKYLTPSTNCTFLARRMWYLYSCGGIRRAWSRVLYLKIWRRYGCCIYPNAEVDCGFYVVHPVGVVIGKCVIGQNFTIYQNTTVGARRELDESKGLIPHIGCSVIMYANSVIAGDIVVADDVIVGANSVVLRDLKEAGTYVGSPAKKVR